MENVAGNAIVLNLGDGQFAYYEAIGESLVELLNADAVSRLNRGITIPEAFPLALRQLYAWRNGEKWEDMFNPIFDFRLLPFEKCVSATAAFRSLYPNSQVIKSALVIGDHAYGNGSIVATRADSGELQLGNLIAEDGIIYSTHDGVVQLLKTTLAAWKEKGDYLEISRRFSPTLGREIHIE